MVTLVKDYPLHKRLIHGLLPALLIHLSIGSVYSWTMLVDKISSTLNCSSGLTQWAFSLAIFFLGISAAFGGRLSERNLTMSAASSTIMFISGLIVTGLGLTIGSIFVTLLGYGCIMGIGLGIGYITPIKNVMTWFPKSSGLAIGSTILGFGLSSSIASWIINSMLDYSANIILFILASIYVIPMFLGTILIKRPDGFVDREKNFTSIFNLREIRSLPFVLIWFIMLLSISSGLALIGNSNQIMAKFTILKVDTILIILILMGLFNGLGRLIVSSATDRLKVKSKIYYSIMGFPILFILAHFYAPDTIPKILLVSSFMYGAGFSCLPIILREKFGIDNLSVIHGLELTAWAVAGLIGNRSGDYLLTEYGVETLLGVLLSLYSLGFILTYILIKTNYKN